MRGLLGIGTCYITGGWIVLVSPERQCSDWAIEGDFANDLPHLQLFAQERSCLLAWHESSTTHNSRRRHCVKSTFVHDMMLDEAAARNEAGTNHRVPEGGGWFRAARP